ncbi:MAG: hypothetical protein JRI73_12700, partial [Deltaproteobacteria bacterium]|nr:hypothetical protein [Deltaproteobacteria bacterium]
TEGTFVSDQDHFFSITDGPYADRDERADQGYPLNIQLDVSVYAFDHPYEDVIYYSARIINHNSHNYSGLYIGLFFDADIPEYNETVLLNDRFDWVGLDRDLETAYVYDYRWGTGMWPEEEAAAYQVHAGLQFLETPGDLGLTDWHWFEWEKRPGVVVPERQERIQFAVLSGDTSGLVPAEDEAYFHTDASGFLDPHFDSADRIPEIYPEGFDCTFLMSTGPFDLFTADTIHFQWALVMGDDLADLLANARLSRQLSENRLVRIHPRIGDVRVEVAPAGPDASRVTVTAETYDHDGLSDVTAYFIAPSGNIIDSLFLFDDGLHSDGAADDSLYGNDRVLTSNMQRYTLDIASQDAQAHRTCVENAASFWAGPGVMPPLDLRAEGQEETVYLSWSPSTDEAAFGYHIYYDTDGPDPPYLGDDATQGQSPVAVPYRNDSTFVLTGLENGETYYITITVYDTAGHESGFPGTVTAVPGIYRPPAVVYRSMSRNNGVELDWTAYEAIAPADVKTFHIYRSDDIGLNYAEIALTDEMTYLDTNLSNSFPYMYRVTVEDQAGQERSALYSLTVTPVPETPGFPLEARGETDYFGATVADIDGDGGNEILVSSRGEVGYALHLLELDGTELAGWPRRLDSPAGVQLTTRAVGDVDGDGHLDIVAGFVDYEYERASCVS